MESESKIMDQLRQLQTIMHRTAFQNFKDHSAYQGQGRILGILSEQPEIGRKELEEKLNISRQGLAELLGKLEKNGQIVRGPSNHDRRSVVIRLTERGRAVVKESQETIHPLTGLLDCLNEEEKAVFSEYLCRILETQKDHTGHCSRCRGPEYCSHDYLKYGHKKPNEAYCKYIHLFTDSASSEAESI